MNVPPTAIAPLMVIGANKVTQERRERQASAIKRLARVGDISLADVAPKGSAQISAQRGDHLPAAWQPDRCVCRKGASREGDCKNRAGDRFAGKLANEKFVANANPDVVAADRERLGDLEGQSASLKLALARISEAA
ncbi:hypothetical protein [Aminobacter anthyllidis]|uniref:hypothetical protein n=1 Tax=Aminobacter anthyllidis TaxID=1035067 RepID=UPI003B75D2CB